MVLANSVAPYSLKNQVEQLSPIDLRVKRLTIAIMILSLVVIGLVACGLFLVTSAPLQLSIWIIASCITLSMLICACYRYQILHSIELLQKN